MAGLHSNVPLLCGGTSTLLRSEDGFVDNVDDELSAGQDCWHPGWVWLAGCSTIHHPQWFSINGRDEKNINFIQFLWLHGIVLPMPPKWPPCWWTVSQLIFVLLPQMRMYYIYIYVSHRNRSLVHYIWVKPISRYMFHDVDMSIVWRRLWDLGIISTIWPCRHSLSVNIRLCYNLLPSQKWIKHLKNIVLATLATLHLFLHP